VKHFSKTFYLTDETFETLFKYRIQYGEGLVNHKLKDFFIYDCSPVKSFTLSRKINFVSKILFGIRLFGNSMASTKNFAAVNPISKIGCLTVVNGGVMYRERTRSSNPITEISSGTFLPCSSIAL